MRICLLPNTVETKEECNFPKKCKIYFYVHLLKMLNGNIYILKLDFKI